MVVSEQKQNAVHYSWNGTNSLVDTVSVDRQSAASPSANGMMTIFKRKRQAGCGH
jgi:hypothetical protein